MIHKWEIYELLLEGFNKLLIFYFKSFERKNKLVTFYINNNILKFLDLDWKFNFFKDFMSIEYKVTIIRDKSWKSRSL